MPDIDLHSLKSLMIFKTLVENGTATQTARVLGITQSGVSRSLSATRTKPRPAAFHPPEKSPAGDARGAGLYDEILRLVSNLDELKHSVMALKEFGASRVGIAVIPGLASVTYHP